MPITVVIDVNITHMRETFRANQRGIRDVVGKSLLNRAQYTARLAASLAPIDTGQLRNSAKVTANVQNNFRITFTRTVRQSARNISRVRGFDIAFWLHEARNPGDQSPDRFSYTPSVDESTFDASGLASSFGGGVDLTSVGRKYLERASLASVESTRIEVSRDLQAFFDQNEQAGQRRRLTRAGRRVEGARPTRRAGPTRRTRPDADSQSTGRMTVRQIEDELESILESAGSVEAAIRNPRFGSLRTLLGELEGF